MDLSAEFPMRPVRPIDFEAGLAAAFAADDPAEAPARATSDRAILQDPITRKLIGPSMPSGQAARIVAIFDELTARGSRGGKAAEVASRLRDVAGEAAEVAGNMRALMYLFLKAVCDDGEDTRLTAASHLVIDTIETMAKRLDSLEDKARLLYAPLIDEPLL